jgi:hypothetical protein
MGDLFEGPWGLTVYQLKLPEELDKVRIILGI